MAIADAIVRAIKAGQLPPGLKLPGTRALAQDLGVHRNTVIAAYAELAAQGWIDSVTAKGTFVTAAAPVIAAPPRAPWHEPATVPVTPPMGTLLAGGVPDLRMVPRKALAAAYRRALLGRREVLDYGDPMGAFRLRAAISDMLRSTRGIACTADDILITRGSQQGIALAARVLLRPGDVVAVEALGYPPAWRALERQGVTLLPIAVDREGLDVDALAKRMRRQKIRAVYVTPHHQYPTLATLSGPRRERLLALGIAIIEDDYDHEFHYAGRPVLPLAAADRSGNTLYIGTLSKILAPALRLGYVVAARNALHAMSGERMVLDRQGDTALETAVADLFEEGEVQRHARRMRRLYMTRRDALVSLLRSEYAHAVDFEVPTGGMSLWLTIKPPRNANRLSQAAAQHGIWAAPGSHFSLRADRLPHLRVGYAGWSERKVAAAVRLLLQ